MQPFLSLQARVHSVGGKERNEAFQIVFSASCSPPVSPSAYSMYCWLPEYVNYGLSSSSFRYEYGIVFELLALKRFEAGAKYDQDETNRGKRRRMKTAGCKIWEGERETKDGMERGFRSFLPLNPNQKRNKA